MKRFALALLPLLAACPPEDGGGAIAIPELPNVRGCSDISIYADSEDRTMSLHFGGDGYVEAAYGGATSTTFDLPSSDVTLELLEGENLGDNGCTDVIEYVDGEPVVQIDVTWTATAGTATLDLTPTGAVYNPCDAPADAILTLDGVIFTSPDGLELPLDALELSVGVGWCPG